MEMRILGGGGDGLPPSVRTALMEALSGAGGETKMRPAGLANLQGLLKGTAQPKFDIGDKVKLREWASNKFKWPTADDVCIVTQTLDTPHRAGEEGTAVPARRTDIALGFVDGDGDVLEFLHDSRMFEKVGSIYDPITLPDGEVLPTV